MSTYLDETRVVWGYAEHPEAEAWQGSGSLADAVAGAEDLADELRENGGHEDASAYVVAGCYPDPGLVAEDALTCYVDHLERIEEYAGDNGLYSDDELFEEDPGAADALRECIRWWGRRYLRARVWSAVGKPVRIKATSR